MQYITHYQSPLGGITMASDGTALTGLWFDGQKYFASTLGADYKEKDLPVFTESKRWLDIYFSGREPDFTPPLSLNSSAFRMAVWQILQSIPYGQTITYGDIAKQLAAQTPRRPAKQKCRRRQLAVRSGITPSALSCPATELSAQAAA